ncbi:MAG: hypothetical protein E7021_00075 [Alphaproteobacteria bacterium]|nr:hypothetical protein [Alphaproteobacteria bacterium]
MRKLLLIVLFAFISTDCYGDSWTPRFYFSDRCPADKPFADGLGNCVGCDYPLFMLGEKKYKKDFDICSNRISYDQGEYIYSVLKECPKENPLRGSYGSCYSCDYLDSNVLIVLEKEDCSICPNAEYHKYLSYVRNGERKHSFYCHKKCPDNQISVFYERHDGGYNHVCSDCYEESELIGERDCQKCPNRVFKDGFCEFRESPPNKPLSLRYDHAVKWFECDTDYAVGTKEECAKCPNREFGYKGCVIKGKKDMKEPFVVRTITFL